MAGIVKDVAYIEGLIGKALTAQTVVQHRTASSGLSELACNLKSAEDIVKRGGSHALLHILENAPDPVARRTASFALANVTADQKRAAYTAREAVGARVIRVIRRPELDLATQFNLCRACAHMAEATGDARCLGNPDDIAEAVAKILGTNHIVQSAFGCMFIAAVCMDEAVGVQVAQDESSLTTLLLLGRCGYHPTEREAVRALRVLSTYDAAAKTMISRGLVDVLLSLAGIMDPATRYEVACCFEVLAHRKIHRKLIAGRAMATLISLAMGDEDATTYAASTALTHVLDSASCHESFLENGGLSMLQYLYASAGLNNPMTLAVTVKICAQLGAAKEGATAIARCDLLPSTVAQLQHPSPEAAYFASVTVSNLCIFNESVERVVQLPVIAATAKALLSIPLDSTNSTTLTILFTRALLFALLQLSARPDCHAALLAQEGLVALKYHLANEDGHSRTIAASACANLARNVMAHSAIIRAALIPAIAALLDDAAPQVQRSAVLAVRALSRTPDAAVLLGACQVAESLARILLASPDTAIMADALATTCSLAADVETHSKLAHPALFVMLYKLISNPDPSVVQLAASSLANLLQSRRGAQTGAQVLLESEEAANRRARAKAQDAEAGKEDKKDEAESMYAESSEEDHSSLTKLAFALRSSDAVTLHCLLRVLVNLSAEKSLIALLLTKEDLLAALTACLSTRDALVLHLTLACIHNFCLTPKSLHVFLKSGMIAATIRAARSKFSLPETRTLAMQCLANVAQFRDPLCESALRDEHIIAVCSGLMSEGDLSLRRLAALTAARCSWSPHLLMELTASQAAFQAVPLLADSDDRNMCTIVSSVIAAMSFVPSVRHMLFARGAGSIVAHLIRGLSSIDVTVQRLAAATLANFFETDCVPFAIQGHLLAALTTCIDVGADASVVCEALRGVTNAVHRPAGLRALNGEILARLTAALHGPSLDASVMASRALGNLSANFCPSTVPPGLNGNPVNNIVAGSGNDNQGSIGSKPIPINPALDRSEAMTLLDCLGAPQVLTSGTDSDVRDASLHPITGLMQACCNATAKCMPLPPAMIDAVVDLLGHATGVDPDEPLGTGPAAAEARRRLEQQKASSKAGGGGGGGGGGGKNTKRDILGEGPPPDAGLCGNVATAVLQKMTASAAFNAAATFTWDATTAAPGADELMQAAFRLLPALTRAVCERHDHQLTIAGQTALRTLFHARASMAMGLREAQAAARAAGDAMGERVAAAAKAAAAERGGTSGQIYTGGSVRSIQNTLTSEFEANNPLNKPPSGLASIPTGGEGQGEAPMYDKEDTTASNFLEEEQAAVYAALEDAVLDYVPQPSADVLQAVCPVIANMAVIREAALRVCTSGHLRTLLHPDCLYHPFAVTQALTAFANMCSHADPRASCILTGLGLPQLLVSMQRSASKTVDEEEIMRAAGALACALPTRMGLFPEAIATIGPMAVALLERLRDDPSQLATYGRLSLAAILLSIFQSRVPDPTHYGISPVQLAMAASSVFPLAPLVTDRWAARGVSSLLAAAADLPTVRANMRDDELMEALRMLMPTTVIDEDASIVSLQLLRGLADELRLRRFMVSSPWLQELQLRLSVPGAPLSVRREIMALLVNVSWYGTVAPTLEPMLFYVSRTLLARANIPDPVLHLLATRWLATVAEHHAMHPILISSGAGAVALARMKLIRRSREALLIQKGLAQATSGSDAAGAITSLLDVELLQQGPVNPSEANLLPGAVLWESLRFCCNMTSATSSVPALAALGLPAEALGIWRTETRVTFVRVVLLVIAHLLREAGTASVCTHVLRLSPAELCRSASMWHGTDASPALASALANFFSHDSVSLAPEDIMPVLPAITLLLSDSFRTNTSGGVHALANFLTDPVMHPYTSKHDKGAIQHLVHDYLLAVPVRAVMRDSLRAVQALGMSQTGRDAIYSPALIAKINSMAIYGASVEIRSIAKAASVNMVAAADRVPMSLFSPVFTEASELSSGAWLNSPTILDLTFDLLVVGNATSIPDVEGMDANVAAALCDRIESIYRTSTLPSLLRLARIALCNSFVSLRRHMGAQAPYVFRRICYVISDLAASPMHSDVAAAYDAFVALSEAPNLRPLMASIAYGILSQDAERQAAWRQAEENVRRAAQFSYYHNRGSGGEAKDGDEPDYPAQATRDAGRAIVELSEGRPATSGFAVREGSAYATQQGQALVPRPHGDGPNTITGVHQPPQVDPSSYTGMQMEQEPKELTVLRNLLVEFLSVNELTRAVCGGLADRTSVTATVAAQMRQPIPLACAVNADILAGLRLQRMPTALPLPSSTARATAEGRARAIGPGGPFASHEWNLSGHDKPAHSLYSVVRSMHNLLSYGASGLIKAILPPQEGPTGNNNAPTSFLGHSYFEVDPLAGVGSGEALKTFARTGAVVVPPVPSNVHEHGAHVEAFSLAAGVFGRHFPEIKVGLDPRLRAYTFWVEKSWQWRIHHAFCCPDHDHDSTAPRLKTIMLPTSSQRTAFQTPLIGRAAYTHQNAAKTSKQYQNELHRYEDGGGTPGSASRLPSRAATTGSSGPVGVGGGLMLGQLQLNDLRQLALSDRAASIALQIARPSLSETLADLKTDDPVLAMADGYTWRTKDWLQASVDNGGAVAGGNKGKASMDSAGNPIHSYGDGGSGAVGKDRSLPVLPLLFPTSTAEDRLAPIHRWMALHAVGADPNAKLQAFQASFNTKMSLSAAVAVSGALACAGLPLRDFTGRCVVSPPTALGHVFPRLASCGRDSDPAVVGYCCAMHAAIGSAEAVRLPAPFVHRISTLPLSQVHPSFSGGFDVGAAGPHASSHLFNGQRGVSVSVPGDDGRRMPPAAFIPGASSRPGSSSSAALGSPLGSQSLIAAVRNDPMADAVVWPAQLLISQVSFPPPSLRIMWTKNREESASQLLMLRMLRDSWESPTGSAVKPPASLASTANGAASDTRIDSAMAGGAAVPLQSQDPAVTAQVPDESGLSLAKASGMSSSFTREARERLAWTGQLLAFLLHFSRRRALETIPITLMAVLELLTRDPANMHSVLRVLKVLPLQALREFTAVLESLERHSAVATAGQSMGIATAMSAEKALRCVVGRAPSMTAQERLVGSLFHAQARRAGARYSLSPQGMSLSRLALTTALTDHGYGVGYSSEKVWPPSLATAAEAAASHALVLSVAGAASSLVSTQGVDRLFNASMFQTQTTPIQMRAQHRFKLFAYATGLASMRALYTSLSQILPEPVAVRSVLGAVAVRPPPGLAPSSGGLLGVGLPGLDESTESIMFKLKHGSVGGGTNGAPPGEQALWRRWVAFPRKKEQRGVMMMASQQPGRQAGVGAGAPSQRGGAVARRGPAGAGGPLPSRAVAGAAAAIEKVARYSTFVSHSDFVTQFNDYRRGARVLFVDTDGSPAMARANGKSGGASRSIKETLETFAKNGDSAVFAGVRNTWNRKRGDLPLLDAFYTRAMPTDGMLPGLSTFGLSLSLWGGPIPLPVPAANDKLAFAPLTKNAAAGTSGTSAMFPNKAGPGAASSSASMPKTPAVSNPYLGLTRSQIEEVFLRDRLAWSAGALPISKTRVRASLGLGEATALWATATTFPVNYPHLATYALVKTHETLSSQLSASKLDVGITILDDLRQAHYEALQQQQEQKEQGVGDASAPAGGAGGPLGSAVPPRMQHPAVEPVLGLLRALSLPRWTPVALPPSGSSSSGGSASSLSAGNLYSIFPLWGAAILRLGVHRTLVAAAQAAPVIPPTDRRGEPLGVRQVPLVVQRSRPHFLPAAHRRLQAAVAEFAIWMEAQARRHGVRIAMLSAAVPSLLTNGLAGQFNSEDTTQKLIGAALLGCQEGVLPQPAFAYAIQASTFDAPDLWTGITSSALVRHMADDPHLAAPADLPFEIRGLLQPIIAEHHLTEAIRGASERLLCITSEKLRRAAAQRALLKGTAGAGLGVAEFAAAATAALDAAESPAQKLLNKVIDAQILDLAILGTRAYDATAASVSLAAAALTVAHTLNRNTTDEVLARRLVALSLPVVPCPSFGAVAQLTFALTVARAPFLADRLRKHMFEEVLAFHGRANRATLEFTASRRALAQILGRLSLDEAMKGQVVSPDEKGWTTSRLLNAAGAADAPSIAAMGAAVSLQLGVAGVSALGTSSDTFPQLLLTTQGRWAKSLSLRMSPEDADYGAVLSASMMQCAEEWGRSIKPGQPKPATAFQPHMRAASQLQANKAQQLRLALEAHMRSGSWLHGIAVRMGNNASRDLQGWLSGSGLRLAVLERRLFWPEYQLSSSLSRIPRLAALLRAPIASNASSSALALAYETQAQISYAITLDLMTVLRAFAKEREKALSMPGSARILRPSSDPNAPDLNVLLPIAAETAAEVTAFLLESSGSGDAEDIGAVLAYHTAKGLNAVRSLQPLRKRDEAWGLRVARRLRNMQLHVHPSGAAGLAELQQLMGVRWEAVVQKVLP